LFGVCFVLASLGNCPGQGQAVGSFTSDAGGNIPAGTTAFVPDAVAGTYTFGTVSGSGVLVASANFTVTAPTIILSPKSGPSGTTVTLTGAGYAPGATYTAWTLTTGTSNCGGEGFSALTFTATRNGQIPNATQTVFPNAAPDNYLVGITSTAGNNFPCMITAAFAETAPTLFLGSSSGPAGSNVYIAGHQFAPGALYTPCIGPLHTLLCGYAGQYLKGFNADAKGGIPNCAAVQVPSTLQPGSYAIGVLLANKMWTTYFLVLVPFNVTAGGSGPTSCTPVVTTTTSSHSSTSNTASGTSTSGGTNGAPQGGSVTLYAAVGLLFVLGLALVAFIVRQRRGRTQQAVDRVQNS